MKSDLRARKTATKTSLMPSPRFKSTPLPPKPPAAAGAPLLNGSAEEEGKRLEISGTPSRRAEDASEPESLHMLGLRQGGSTDGSGGALQRVVG